MVHRFNKIRMGQGVAEYAILIALLALVLIAILSLIGISPHAIYKKTACLFKRPASSQVDARLSFIASPTGEEASLFVDDFNEDALPHWIVLDAGLWQGHWQTVDGKAVGEPLSAMLANRLPYRDFVVRVDGVNLDNSLKDYMGFGVFFRTDRQPKVDGYLFEYEKKDPTDPGLIYFSKWLKGNQIFPPIASTAAPATFNWDAPHNIEVHVRSDTFSAFIDGALVLQGNDTLFTEGTAGLMVNNGSTTTIENFKIEPLY